MITMFMKEGNKEVSIKVHETMVNHIGILLAELSAEDRENIMKDTYSRHPIKNTSKVLQKTNVPREEVAQINADSEVTESGEEILPEDQSQSHESNISEAWDDMTKEENELKDEMEAIMVAQDEAAIAHEEEVREMVEEFDRKSEPSEKEMNDLAEFIDSDPGNIYSVAEQATY